MYYNEVTYAFKWALKLPRKTETYESPKSVPCNTRKCTLNGYGTYIHRIHKWRTRGKKLVPSHESEALEDKQKLQMKTFSDLQSV